MIINENQEKEEETATDTFSEARNRWHLTSASQKKLKHKVD